MHECNNDINMVLSPIILFYLTILLQIIVLLGAVKDEWHLKHLFLGMAVEVDME